MNIYEENVMMKAAYLDAARAAIMAYLDTTDFPSRDVIIAIIMGKAPEKKEEE